MSGFNFSIPKTVRTASELRAIAEVLDSLTKDQTWSNNEVRPALTILAERLVGIANDLVGKN